MNIKRDIKKSQKIMFCQNCGAELQDPNQTFCPNCGTPLKGEVQLDSNKILVLPDTHSRKIWVWQGSNTTVRKKFITSRLVETTRAKYGSDYTIERIDEGSEPLEFKIMIGLEEEPDNPDVLTENLSERTNEDQEFLEYLFKEKKWLSENRNFETLEESLDKINSIMEKESKYKLIINRKDLSEIFSPELIELSSEDDLPKLKPFVLEYFKRRGITGKISGNINIFSRNFTCIFSRSFLQDLRRKN